jgi:hypothetical protein
MPTLTLTAAFVRSVTPSDHRVEYCDRDTRGLVLRVSRNGTKLWTLRYWNKHQQQRRVTLGSVKAVSLATARDRARTEQQKIREGADPSAQTHVDRHAKTINELADLYIERWAKPRKKLEGGPQSARPQNPAEVEEPRGRRYQTQARARVGRRHRGRRADCGEPRRGARVEAV